MPRLPFATNAGSSIFGVGTASADLASYVGASTTGWSYHQDGRKFYNGSPELFGATLTTGDIIGVAIKNGKIWFSKNGTWQASGNPETEANPAYSNLTGTVYPAISGYSQNSVATVRTMAGEFSYSPPSGFSAIASGDSVSITGSGGAEAGGAADFILAASVIATGGGVGGGEATIETYDLAESVSITGSGGAVAGGASEYIREASHIAAGGAVAGGAATIKTPAPVWVEGVMPDMYGEVDLFVTPAAVIEGVMPLMYGDIQTGWSIEGVMPMMYGEISAVTKIHADMEGVMPSMYGEIDARGIFCNLEGVMPPMYGDIDATGSITFSTLAFPARVHVADDGITNAPYSDTILQFVRQ